MSIPSSTSWSFLSNSWLPTCPQCEKSPQATVASTSALFCRFRLCAELELQNLVQKGAHAILCECVFWDSKFGLAAILVGACLQVQRAEATHKKELFWGFGSVAHNNVRKTFVTKTNMTKDHSTSQNRTFDALCVLQTLCMLFLAAVCGKVCSWAANCGVPSCQPYRPCFNQRKVHRDSWPDGFSKWLRKWFTGRLYFVQPHAPRAARHDYI